MLGGLLFVVMCRLAVLLSRPDSLVHLGVRLHCNVYFVR